MKSVHLIFDAVKCTGIVSKCHKLTAQVVLRQKFHRNHLKNVTDIWKQTVGLTVGFSTEFGQIKGFSKIFPNFLRFPRISYDFINFLRFSGIYRLQWIVFIISNGTQFMENYNFFLECPKNNHEKNLFFRTLVWNNSYFLLQLLHALDFNRF